MADKVYYIAFGFDDSLENIKNKYPNAEQFTPTTKAEVDKFFQNDTSNILTLVLVGTAGDLKTPTIKYTVNKFLENGIQVTCINVKTDEMVYLFGISLTTNYYVVQPYTDSEKIINLVGVNQNLSSISTEKQSGQPMQSGTTKINRFTSYRKPKNEKLPKSKILNIPATPIQIASEIGTILQEPVSTGVKGGLLQSSPGLPEGQIQTFYIKYNDTFKFLNADQKATNALVFKVDLVASYSNPPYKYLQITLLGSGLNPTSGKGMFWNDEFNRGWYQQDIDIVFQPSENTNLTALQTSPSNINNQTTYKSGSSFNVGVNVSANPGFNSNYTFSNDYTTVISDFQIINKSSGNVAEWEYILSMTKNDDFDIFNNRTLLQPTVKELPALATQNLQPTSIVLWYTDNSYNSQEFMSISINLAYRHAYSESDGLGWNSFVQKQNFGPTFQNLSIDFSQVQA